MPLFDPRPDNECKKNVRKIASAWRESIRDIYSDAMWSIVIEYKDLLEQIARDPKNAVRLLRRAHELQGVMAALAYNVTEDLTRVNTWTQAALKDCDPLSPLILDLDGDGVEADALTHFDHEGDGWSELSRWANEDDGVLVWDRNTDGVINDGSELFGNNTVLSDGSKADHGFAALADLDDNGDGVIDSDDAAWSELRVMRWTDENENGMKDDGEEYFQTLDELGIRSLRTAYTNSDYVDESGNEHRQVGSYTKTDGTTATMTDVWFVTSTSTTQYDRSHIPEHSDAITALPEVHGGGVVYSLRDAMALDAAGQLQAPFYGDARTETRTLGQMVSDFTAVDESGAPVLDKAAREELAEKILLRWAGAEGATNSDYWYWHGTFPTAADMSYTKSYKIAVIEAFQGGQWRAGQSYRNPAYSTGQKINRGYLNHLERLYGNLMLQTHLKDVADAVTVGLKEGAAADSILIW